MELQEDSAYAKTGAGNSPENEGWLSRQTEEVQAYIRKLRDKEAKLRLKTGLGEKENEIAELRKAMQERDDNELREKHEYKQLFEQTITEKSDLENQNRKLSDELKAYKEQYEAERLELLNKLAPDERDIFSSLSKPQLRKILEKSIRMENSAGARNAAAESMDVMKISAEEWAVMSVENPEQYNTLKTKHLKLLRGRK